MEIQLISITTYRGISSDAEHFYAKAAKREQVEESLMFNSVSKLESICSNIYDGEELKFFPDRIEAIDMCKKDNQMMWNGKGAIKPITEEQIWEMQNNGTIRFPSVLSVIKTARKKWPEAVLFFTLQHSRERFLKCCLKDGKLDPEIVKLLMHEEK